jgi:branched-chain amino acid transport system permease protein
MGTLGVAIMLENGTAALMSPDPVAYPRALPNVAFNVAGLGVSSLQLVNLGISLLVLAACSFYVRRTRYGRATRAIAERREVAAAFGVDVNRVSQLTVLLASAMAGIAAVSVGLLYGSAWAFVGALYAVKSFVCMLVAGNRHVEGVMLVALTLGVVEALVTGYLSSSLRDAVAFFALILVLYFRPAGLFGSYPV